MILRCTQRLLKGSGLQLAADPPTSDAALGEWFANVVPLPFAGRSVVMYSSANTLLTVLVPGRAVRTTLPGFRERLPRLLERLGLPPEWIREQALALEPVYYARTNDRRVLGTMNDLANGTWFWAEDAGSFDRFDLDRTELELAGTPLRMLDSSSPDIMVTQLARPGTDRYTLAAELHRRHESYRRDPGDVIPIEEALDDIERSLG
ncbi:MAG TPA: hypothetical protein VF092_28310 [Longimicrobium sp.]